MKDPARRFDAFVAGYALAGIAIHDGAHLLAGRWYDVFWVCNLAALSIGPAILLRSPRLAQLALTWLLPGTAVWLTDVFVAGSNILPTSYNVHFGGTLAAAYGVWRTGYAPRGWLAALGFLVCAWLLSRLFLPAAHNVNAAHGVPQGWRFLGETPLGFALAGTGMVVALCAAGQLLAWFIVGRRRGRAG